MSATCTPIKSEHTVFGWHVHFSYPWDVSNEPSPPPDPKAPRPRAVYDMPYVVGSASSTVDASRLAGPFHGDLVSSLATAWAPIPLLAATASEPEFRPAAFVGCVTARIALRRPLLRPSADARRGIFAPRFGPLLGTVAHAG